MTVADLGRRMGARELAEWMAFCSLEPLPDDRADARSAMQCMLMASAWGDPKQRRPKMADFLLFQDAPPTQTTSQQQQVAKAVSRLNDAIRTQHGHRR
jgi:hypothetical protein